MDDEKWLDRQLEMDPDSPMDRAMDWVSRLATGAADAAPLAEFVRWRDSDSRNEKALIEARRLWLLLGGPLEAQYAPVVAGATGRGKPVRGVRGYRQLLALAAVLVLAIGLSAQWLHDWRYDHVTATGEQRTLTLDDGSTMWLNTGSAVDTPMAASGRYVRLVRGEAYFDVAKRAGRVFTVDAGPGRIKVLGTAFGVRRDGEDVVVTVRRGRVEVAGRSGAPVVLGPNQTARVHADDPIEAVASIDAEQALAWRNGLLMFENRPLAVVLKELERYDRRLVIVSYPQADTLRVSSIVDLARIDEWYATLGQSLPVVVSRLGPFVWIHPQPARTAAHIVSVGTPPTSG